MSGLFSRELARLRRAMGVLAVALALAVGPATHANHSVQWEEVQSGPISATEFARIVTDFSEDDGFFRSDNFISNETSYLHVVDKIRSMGCVGGAYIGVGPEQNFTYIAKIRPKIAFIVDIRRQAVIQHLMYKAIFHLADTRAEFLSLLFSKLISADSGLEADTPIEKLISYFESAPTDYSLFDRNLRLIRKTIWTDFHLPLSAHDQTSLEYVYSAFRNENLDIQYRSGGLSWSGHPWGAFPTLKEIILERDLRGEMGNFLVSRADYEFVREMQERNRIIPIVGDFSGSKALPSVAAYLKKDGYWVTAFYTSNVEQYLFNNGVFSAFVENVARLPISDRSIFIRAYPNMREPHPAKISGHRLTTLLEKIQVFLRDYSQGLYGDYWSLVTTHFIAAGE